MDSAGCVCIVIYLFMHTYVTIIKEEESMNVRGVMGMTEAGEGQNVIVFQRGNKIKILKALIYAFFTLFL